ncbi:hypothetical protein ABIC75_004467 [Dyella japonica]|uniref:Uncharacterized protein n=1 Tax=Dyella japonica TaxID=231455 RepID=A0ABV2K0W1_9GAMM
MTRTIPLVDQQGRAFEARIDIRHENYGVAWSARCWDSGYPVGMVTGQSASEAEVDTDVRASVRAAGIHGLRRDH